MSGPYLSSSVADHPLRSATRLSLGKLLPYQQADRPRTYPKAPGPKVPSFGILFMRIIATCGINPPFGRLSPTLGKVVHVLRTRSPLSCYFFTRRIKNNNLARLACLNHAASVHSEPGSNSPKNFGKHKIRKNLLMRFACWLARLFIQFKG